MDAVCIQAIWKQKPLEKQLFVLPHLYTDELSEG